MASGQWVGVFKQVSRVFHGRSVAGMTEGQILDRFVSTRDEVAFEAILARHGPMVLRVCRASLNDPRDVEDAFQATFLVLVRKAAGLRDRDHLGRWLHGVARKVSTRARADAWKRRNREKPGLDLDLAATLDTDLRDLQSIVREEVDRLSCNERSAVVLCYLEGLTHEEAADRLGWPIGTVKGRLSRARERLRTRLARRGVAIPAGAVASTLSGGASPIVPSTLIASATMAAVRVAAGQSLNAGVVSAHVAILTEGVIQTMSLTKLKLGAVAVVAACTIVTPGVVAWQGPGGTVDVKVEKEVAVEARPDGQKRAIDKETEQAGSLDINHRILDSAQKAVRQLGQGIYADDSIGPDSYTAYPTWSRRLLDAQLAVNQTRESRLAALKSYADRSKSFKDVASKRKMTERERLESLDAEFAYHQALKWLAEAEAEPEVTVTKSATRVQSPQETTKVATPPPAPINPALARIAKRKSVQDQRNQSVEDKLDERLSMPFAELTPLEDIIKYLQVSTMDEAAGFPNGIPIYLDPKGMKTAQAKVTSPVAINIQGVPLRTTLRLLLSQIDLDYTVEDGLVIISDTNGIMGIKNGFNGMGGMGGMGGGFR